MREIICEVREDEIDGGFVARALGQSIHTQADSVEELRAIVKDAVACHFGEEDRPRIIRLHFVRDEVLAADDA
jgi:predicted RNase H-like HicB family nuclease